MPNEAPAKVVIRSRSTAQRWLLGGGSLVTLLLSLYVAYEFGRFDAGYDRQAVAVLKTEHDFERARLEAEIRQLRGKIAEYETAGISATRERAEVARTIGELQAQVAREEQDVAFYRGIAQQNPEGPEVKIQQLRIAATLRPGRFQVRFNIVQPVQPVRAVAGALGMQLEGVAGDGKTIALGLADITADKRHELPFTFRYFQNFDETIVLPAGFKPERLTVTVRSSRKGVAPVTQSFVWTVDAG
ncbi:MAG: DUF6776 family protein [Steroidobacteraceae bacterium]